MTSSGVSDAGLFEQNLRDERYLPFEGAGVIGDYAMVLPIETNRFDVAAVNDVLLHVRYTARSGGDALANSARGYYANSLPKRYRLLSLRAELPTAWASFITVSGNIGDPQVLSIPLARGMFPLAPSTKKVALKNVTLYARWSGTAYAGNVYVKILGSVGSVSEQTAPGDLAPSRCGGGVDGSRSRRGSKPVPVRCGSPRRPDLDRSQGAAEAADSGGGRSQQVWMKCHDALAASKRRICW